MNVASLPLCKELHALGGWNGGEYFDGENYITQEDVDMGGYDDGQCAVVYDLGFLLRHMPEYLLIDGYYRNLVITVGSGYWTARYGRVVRRATTPEDAVAKLGIDLFKKQVISREATS